MKAGIPVLLAALAVPALATTVDAQQAQGCNPVIPGRGPCAQQPATPRGTPAWSTSARRGPRWDSQQNPQQGPQQGRRRQAPPAAARPNAAPGAPRGARGTIGRGTGARAWEPGVCRYSAPPPQAPRAQGRGRGQGLGAGAVQGQGRGRGQGLGAGSVLGQGRGRGPGCGAGAVQGQGRGRGQGFGAGTVQGLGRGRGAGWRTVGALRPVGPGGGPCVQPIAASDGPPSAEVAAFVERLRDALGKEIFASNYYLAASDALGNAGPPRFERLARAEQNHSEAIRRAILLLGGEVVEPEALPVAAPKTLNEAYEGGLDIERTVIDLYKGLIRDCPDERVLWILENIQAANQRHLGAFGG